MLVAIAFLFAYRASEYRQLKRTGHSQRPMNIFLAAADALNPTDLFTGAAYAVRLLLSGVGPRGNGSWKRNGGYEKMRGGADSAFDSSTAYPGRSGGMRLGRVAYQQPYTTDFDSNPPTYDDARPLRSSSPTPYTSSPHRGRSPSPNPQPYYPAPPTRSPPSGREAYLLPFCPPEQPELSATARTSNGV